MAISFSVQIIDHAFVTQTDDVIRTVYGINEVRQELEIQLRRMLLEEMHKQLEFGSSDSFLIEFEEKKSDAA